MAALAVGYAWVIGAGSVTAWPGGSSYYGQLAAAFARGQTHLPVGPPAAMLALPDPYDPQANDAYRLNDALLYGGKYYLYWGPVPALFLVPLARVGAGVTDHGSDALLAFGFAVGTAASAAALLLRVRHRLFPDRAGWTVALGVGVVGWAGPIPYALARPSVYEAAILGGQCFMMTGVYCAYRSLFPAPSARRVTGRPIPAWLAAAAACWAAAVGSRLSLGPAVAVMGLLVLWRVWRPVPEGCRGALARTVAFAVPALAGAMLLASYNFARFGAWTQTGWKYQVGGVNVPDGVARGWLVSARYVPGNLLCYLCENPAWVPEFPFLYAGTGGPLSATAATASPHYGLEAVVGVLPVWPVLCLGLIPLLPSVWRRRRAAPAAAGSISPAGDACRGEAAWLVPTLAAAAAIGFVPGLLLCGLTLRYLVDLAPTAGVLAVVGVWLTAPAPAVGPGRRGAWSLGVGLLVLFSAATASGLAFTGYHARFDARNPGLMRALRQTLSPWAVEPPPGVPPPGLD
ncbi:MAG: hypothetical protein JWO31_1128 [Phycisphaerales bacterium]|nr:hypothetical protein [Phycisphaerales bacterium]